MTGLVYANAKRWPVSLALMAAIGLTACGENGGFSLPSSENERTAERLPANALGQRVQQGVDVERPDIFEITDRGLWDGRPSLGGVWVAHPDVVAPDRVVIRNTETGQSIVGALFRRERENPGPLLQVSSDAAEALGMLPGAPTELDVVVLRREETVIVPDAATNPVIASLEAPVSVAEAPLDPVAADDAPETDDGDAAAAAAVVVLPPALDAAVTAAQQSGEAATAAAAATVDAAPSESIDVSAVLAAPLPPPVPAEPLPAGAMAQIGVYSIEANANADAQRIIATGIDASVMPEELGGRTVWRVLAGPLADTALVMQLKGMGFVDTFVIDPPVDDAESDG